MDEDRQLWQQYYDKALSRKHSPRTEFAAGLNESGCKVAIDCGCGTGSDIHYLSQLGYRVHGFDINDDSIAICDKRFAGNALVEVSKHGFEDYDYPRCGLVVANSSLFFSDPERFAVTWARISDCIEPGGVFAGDFMGIEDSWVSGSRHCINAMMKPRVQGLFECFDIVHFQERSEQGMTALGKPKHWHTFSVVAVKPR